MEGNGQFGLGYSPDIMMMMIFGIHFCTKFLDKGEMTKNYLRTIIPWDISSLVC